MNFGENTEVALFATLDHLPLSTIITVLSIVLISTFFITSADSATFVIGMQTTNGMLNPPLLIKLTWGIIQASAAAVLLWSGGDRKSTRLNSSHVAISYAVFCLKK